MMASIIDLSIRRIIAVGGSLGHIAGLDNFCWPDPVQSEKTPDGEYKLAQLIRANKALYDYTKAFKTPCISGKDSMKNDSTRGGRKISIPPTVLFSTIAKMDDISKAITLDAKFAGDIVYIIGSTKDELGGSEYFAMMNAIGNSVPKVDADYAINIYEKVSKLTEKGLVNSLHTPGIGGLAAGFAKVAMAGRLGLDIDLDCVPVEKPLEIQNLLFSESNSRFIMTASPDKEEDVEKLLKGVPYAKAGKVISEQELILRKGSACVKTSMDEMLASYKGVLEGI
jgi:phosphoribosylformylglycinamidine synthase